MLLLHVGSEAHDQVLSSAYPIDSWARVSSAASPRAPSRGSGSCPRAAEPFIQADAATARLTQRHERVLLDPAAEVSGLGVAHDLTRLADRLQVAGDDFVERRSCG